MYEFAQIQTTVVVVLGAVAAFVLIGSGQRVWKDFTRPGVELRQLVDKHDERLMNDHERLNELKKSNDLQAKLLLQIANHLIDGNHTKQMIDARDDMQDYLISR